MKTNTKLRVGTISGDGKWLYIGLDTEGEFTESSDPYVLLRMNIENSNHHSVWPEAKLEGGKKWFSVNSYEYVAFCKKRPELSEKVTAWRAYLKAEAILYRSLKGSPLALPKQESRLIDGICRGTSDPGKVARHHIATDGSTDLIRIALANREALGDNPIAVGEANATAYFGDMKKIVQCNIIAFKGDPKKVGKANRGSFVNMYEVTKANWGSFDDGGVNPRFVKAMYASFEDEHAVMLRMFIYIYEGTRRDDKYLMTALAMQELYKNNPETFKEACLYVAEHLQIIHQRAETVRCLGLVLFFLAKHNEISADSLIEHIFSSKEDIKDAKKDVDYFAKKTS